MSENTTDESNVNATSVNEGARFTQDDVNHFIAEAKRDVQVKYADYQELKDQVADLDNIKSSAYESGKTDATNELTSELVKTEIRGAATALGFHSVEDVLAFYGDRSEITYTPDSGVDVAKIQGRLNELANEKPYLVKQQVTEPDATNSRPKPKSGTQAETPEAPGKKEQAAAALKQNFKR